MKGTWMEFKLDFSRF